MKETCRVPTRTGHELPLLGSLARSKGQEMPITHPIRDANKPVDREKCAGNSGSYPFRREMAADRKVDTAPRNCLRGVRPLPILVPVLLVLFLSSCAGSVSSAGAPTQRPTRDLTSATSSVDPPLAVATSAPASPPPFPSVVSPNVRPTPTYAPAVARITPSPIGRLIASVVPAHGPFMYVNQFGTGKLNSPDGATAEIAGGLLTLPSGQRLHLQAQHLYTFLGGQVVGDYEVSTGTGGSTPIRSGTLGLFDRGKTLHKGDPGWLVLGGVYVDNFWALFPDTDPDSNILIHTLPFHPYANGKHDVNSYYGQVDLGVQESSSGCIRMWPGTVHHASGFNDFTKWAKAMQLGYGAVPFTIGP